MLEYFFFNLCITSIFYLPYAYTVTNKMDEFVGQIRTSLVTLNNAVKFEKDGIEEYRPTDKQRVEIWKYIFANKKQLDVCEHGYDELTDNLFNREFEKNKRSKSIYEVEKNKFFVQVKCSWANYQGNFEFYTYDTFDNKVILKRLLLRRFSRNSDGSLTELYSKSVGGFPVFGAKHKTLRISSRTGGGDCGSNLVEYQYENSELNLVSVRENYECLKHEGSYSPNQYPIIYPVPSQ
jgi:hypothetical protein